MNHIPYEIEKQRQQLQELTDSKALFGSMVKLRDVTEVMLRLPVLCAGAFILAKGGSEKELLTLELVKHDKIDSRGWLQVANAIHKNGNIPKPLKTIIDRVCHWITSEKLIEWRHAEVAHGALKFNPDRAFVKDFGKKMKSLDKLLKQLEKDYKDISVSDDGSTVTYMGETLQVAPYIFSDSGEAYLFDTYRNGLAKGLCYALGVKRAMPSQAYVQAYMAQADRLQASGVTGEVITSEMSAAIDELNEAANFEHPTYLRDWLVEGMNAGGSGIAKGTLLLEMERGMGKSAFARALDGKSTDSSYQSFKIGDSFARGYYCSRVGIRSKGDFLFGVRNSLLTDEKDQLLYSSDEKIPSLSENGTPEDFAELLNWCRDHVNEKRLLLIIDGIDEIPAEHSDILKMLPTAEMLKDGVYILITCRSKEQVKDGMKDQKLLEDENRQIETVRSYIHPDRERAYSCDEQHNLETLTSYFNRKILPKDGKKSKRNDKLETDIQTIINEPGQKRFLEVRIIGTLIKSGKVKDIGAFAEHPDLFQYYLDYLRTEEYGDAVFSRLTEMLAALACAQEELTFGELAYLLGEDDVTMQLLTFVCDMAGILRISRDYRGNHISLASDEYRTRILEAFHDTVQLHKQAVADILECVDINEAIRKDDLPDGLLYLMAYATEFAKSADLNLLRKIDDVSVAIQFYTDRMKLERRLKMCLILNAEGGYLEKEKQYELCLSSLLGLGTVYAILNQQIEAIDTDTRLIKLAEQYLKNGWISDEMQLFYGYYNRGNAYNRLTQYSEALSDYNSCVDIMDHEALDTEKTTYLINLINNRSVSHMGLFEFQAALDDVDRCISLYQIIRSINHYDAEVDDLMAGAYMNKCAIYLQTGEYNEALSSIDHCITIRERLYERNDLRRVDALAKAYVSKAEILTLRQEHFAGILFFKMAITLLEELLKNESLRDIEALITTYISFGVCLKKCRLLKLALENMTKGIDMAGIYHYNNQSDFATFYHNRGNLYYDMKDFSSAMRDYSTGISIFNKLKKNGLFYNPYDLSRMYGMRGILAHDMGDYRQSITDKTQCIEIQEQLLAENFPFDKNDLANYYMNRGVTWVVLKDYQKAKDDYDKSIQINLMLLKSGELEDLVYLGDVLIKKSDLLTDFLKDIEGGLKVLEQGITIFESEDNLSWDAQEALEGMYERKIEFSTT